MSTKQLYIWDGINSELEAIESIEEAQKWVKENLTDAEDGIHPDAESIYLFEQIGGVEVLPVDGKDYFIIKMAVTDPKWSIQEQIKKLSKLSKRQRILNADSAYTLGVSLGYPTCCVKQFCDDILNDRNPGELRNIDGSGFIPCTEHYHKIRNNSVTISELTINPLLEENARLREALEKIVNIHGIENHPAGKIASDALN